MKTYKYILPFFVLLLMSCMQNSELTSLKGDSDINYKESFAKWNELKKTNGNSYTYQATFSSWTGFGSITEFRIENGKVVSRTYQEFSINDTTGHKETRDIYTETVDDLNSHERGVTPLTIDELYDSCAKDYLIADTDENTLYFNTELNGTMNLCGYVPNNCADDCYHGIRINSFQWID